MSAEATSTHSRLHDALGDELARRGRRLLTGAVTWGLLGVAGTFILDGSSLELNTNQASTMVFVYLVFGTVTFRLGNFFATRFWNGRVRERLDAGTQLAVRLVFFAMLGAWLAALVLAGDVTFRFLVLTACITAGAVLLKGLLLVSATLLGFASLIAIGLSLWSHPSRRAIWIDLARVLSEAWNRLVSTLAGRPLVHR